LVARRRFLQGLSALGFGAAASGSALGAQASHLLEPAVATEGFDPQIELELRAEQGQVSMLEGVQTPVWRFAGEVFSGPEGTLTYLDGAGHIPVISVRRGQKIRIYFRNLLPEATIVHWHGLNIPQRMDGHPMYAIAPGSSYVYEFTVDNRAGTYWFHPHPHERTAFQVYQGLTGLLLVGDAIERAARLPEGDYDLPLVLQDRSFDSQGNLQHLGPARHDWMMGFSGQRVLVNGKADYHRGVDRAAYRVRLFNGSNSTLYRLYWSDEKPFTIIATDGGLLANAINQQFITIGVGERVDVWVDLSGRDVGDTLHLMAESYNPRLENITAAQQGAELQGGARAVARLTMAEAQASRADKPRVLSRPPNLSVDDAVNIATPKQINIAMRRGQFMLNGRVFGDMREVAPDDRVSLGTSEVWEFVNDSQMGMGRGMGGMMQMAHPMHVHNVQFKVIRRSAASPQSVVAEALAKGFTDFGLKDVVLVMPGERVQVIMRFENHPGIYLYHCHILEHEDLGMMRNYQIDPS
jgi:FtsP/CotA-like multicopper oxidase with cupredoxin domain